MKFLVFLGLYFLYFIKNNVGLKVVGNAYICDFYFNPTSSVRPILGGKNDEPEEVACTVNNPMLSDIIFLICPKRKDDNYSDIELVPIDCFSSHLYSPYTAGKNEKDIEKIDIDKKYTHSFSFNDYEIKTFMIPTFYKHNKTIYCRCDNRKTEKEFDDKQKYQGKTGIVKIILSEKTSDPKLIDFTTSDVLKNKDIIKNGAEVEIHVVENEIFSVKLKDVQDTNFNGCNIPNVRFSPVIQENYDIRTPTIFFNDIKCVITFKDKNDKKYIVTVLAKKTENIEGCDFTKPKGDGMFKGGFVLSNISEQEKTCTAHIGSSKKHIVAGIKCPNKLIPSFCFRYVLYEKEINGNKEFKTFALEDILDTKDIEYYSNLKEGAFVVGLPIKSEKYASIRCICEEGGKKGIMELKIASSYNSFISFILLFITIILLYLF